MVWDKFKLLLLVWPIILLAGFLGNSLFQRHQIDKKLVDADGLVWKAGENQFIVHINQREYGEQLDIQIQVTGPDNKEVYKKVETIDRDMFGGGFVRAVQVDKDFEDEIVVWHAQARYYLDFSEGNVSEVSFDHVPRKVKDLAVSWHKHNVVASLEIAILLIFVITYYILYAFIKIILVVFKRKNSSFQGKDQVIHKSLKD